MHRERQTEYQNKGRTRTYDFNRESKKTLPGVTIGCQKRVLQVPAERHREDCLTIQPFN
jgi:hypothetical protein